VQYDGRPDLRFCTITARECFGRFSTTAPTRPSAPRCSYILSGEDQRVGTMFQIFSVIIETIKDPLFA
jgi:hypothetical protein